MSNQEVHFLKVLESLEKLESEIAILYGGFATYFGDNPEVAAIFQRLARDEEAHRDILAYQRRLVLKNPKEFTAIPFDMADLAHTISKIKRFRAEHSTAGLDKAVAFSIELESLSSEQYFRTAVTQSNPKVSLLCRRLGKADEKHQQDLRVLHRANASLPEERHT